MKLLVDVAKLEADGTITPQQAVQIRRAAAADTGTLAINVIATIGAFAVVAGLLAMRPTSVQVAVIGLGLTFVGALIRKFRQTQLGFLGSSLIVIGAVLLAAGLILKCSGLAPRASSFLFTCPATPKWYGHMVLFLVASAWLLAVGALAQNGLLVVLSAFALAGALGSSTGYWHASYGLLVRESTVTIVVFGLLGALASYLSMRVLQGALRSSRTPVRADGAAVGELRLLGRLALGRLSSRGVDGAGRHVAALQQGSLGRAEGLEGPGVLYFAGCVLDRCGRWRWPALVPGARCTVGAVP